MDNISLKKCPVCDNLFKQNVFFELKYYKLLNGIEDFTVKITQCDKCGFVFQNPRPSVKILSNYYKSEPFSVAYERGTKIIPTTTYNRFVRVEKFWYDSNITPKGKILDLGTHTGQFLLFLKERNYECVGIELSEKAAETGHEWYDVNIIVGDIKDLDKIFERRSIQFITIFHLLEHLTDFPAFFEKISYVLAPNGIINIEIPDLLRMNQNYPNYFYIEHISYFTLETIDILLNRFGFERINGEQIPIDYPDDQGKEMPSIIVIYRKKEKIDFLFDSIQVSESLFTFFQSVLSNLNMKIKYINKVIKESQVYKKLYIWGSGSHTLFLRGLDELANAVAIIDSNEKKWGQKMINLPIISPGKAQREIKKNDAILISSYSGELSILSAAEGLFPEIKTFCLYNENENLEHEK